MVPLFEIFSKSAPGVFGLLGNQSYCVDDVLLIFFDFGFITFFHDKFMSKVVVYISFSRQRILILKVKVNFTWKKTYCILQINKTDFYLDQIMWTFSYTNTMTFWALNPPLHVLIKTIGPSTAYSGFTRLCRFSLFIT